MLSILIIIVLTSLAVAYNKMATTDKRELAGLMMILQLALTNPLAYEMFSKTMETRGEIYTVLLVWSIISVYIGWDTIKSSRRS